MAAATTRSSLTSLLVIVLLFALAFIGYRFLTMPDQRSTGDKISDAWHELPNDPGKAGRELEDRTPGQKLGDTIKDNTESK